MQRALPPDLQHLVEEYSTSLKTVMGRTPALPGICCWRAVCNYLKECIILTCKVRTLGHEQKRIFKMWCDFFDVYMSNFLRIKPTLDEYVQFCVLCLDPEYTFLGSPTLPDVAQLIKPKLSRAAAGFTWKRIQCLGAAFNEACLYSDVSRDFLLTHITDAIGHEDDSVEVCLRWLLDLWQYTLVELGLDALAGYGPILTYLDPHFPLTSFRDISKATCDRLQARTLGELALVQKRPKYINRKLWRELRYLMTKAH